MSGLRLIGYPVSPFVRKVRVVLALKGIVCELDPAVPFKEKERLLPLNPKGSVPILVTGDGPMAESGDIVRWLEERHPEPPVLPSDPDLLARVDEIEAWGNSRFARVFGGGLFFQRVIAPYYLDRDPDRERVLQAAHIEAPALLAELEERLGDGQWLAGEFGLADIAIAIWVRAGLLAGFELDARALPKTAAWIERTLSHKGFAEVVASEDAEPVAAWIKTLPPIAREAS